MPTGDRRPSEALQWRAVLGVANYRGRSTILPFSGRPWESAVTRLRGAQADATSGAHLPLPHHRSGWNRRVIDSFDCASPARTEFSTSNCGSGSENAEIRVAPRPSRRSTGSTPKPGHAPGLVMARSSTRRSMTMVPSTEPPTLGCLTPDLSLATALRSQTTAMLPSE